MTEILCHNDSYLREFDATVVAVLDRGVVLDRTVFYPGGGGQPTDMGILTSGGDRYVVKKLSRIDSQVVHEIEGDDRSVVGDEVHGVIDWERRYSLMQTHTALHIMGGIVWRDFGAHITGGDMKPGSGRLDFELDQMSSGFAGEVEKSINEEVTIGREIVIKMLPREEAFQIPDLIRTKINLLPAGIQEVRIVDIKGLDLQADGGTHVANTREVGTVRVVGHGSKGRINKRLRIEVG